MDVDVDVDVDVDMLKEAAGTPNKLAHKGGVAQGHMLDKMKSSVSWRRKMYALVG